MEGPYLNELNSGRAGLTFRNRRLESEYRTFAVNRDRESLRLQVLIGMLLICILMFMDRFLMAPEFFGRTFALRLGVMLPPMLALYALTWSRHLKQWIEPLGVLAGLAVGLTSLAIGSLAEQYEQLHVFSLYQVVVIFIYFCLGLRVMVAMATAGTLLGAYLATAIVTEVNSTVIAYNGVFLLFMNLIGATGAFQMNKTRRTVFLEDRILSYRANHDALTSLPNRRAFDEVLTATWDSALEMRCPVAVLMLDIDHFKSYNDLYGHQAGDNTIRAVAQILKSNLQRPQDFAGRYGGEEFVILLFDTTKDYAMQLGERIREQVLGLDIRHERSEAARCVSVSIGMACLVPFESHRSARGFVQSADQAMYSAKENGRNQVVDADLSVSGTTTGVFRVMHQSERQLDDVLRGESSAGSLVGRAH